MQRWWVRERRPRMAFAFGPLEGEEMERAILGRGDWNEPGVERAADAFAADVGAPRSEGVEYKRSGLSANPPSCGVVRSV